MSFDRYIDEWGNPIDPLTYTDVDDPGLRGDDVEHDEHDHDAETSWSAISLRDALTGDGIPDPVLLRREDNVRLLYPGRIHWFFGIPESLKS